MKNIIRKILPVLITTCAIGGFLSPIAASAQFVTSDTPPGAGGTQIEVKTNDFNKNAWTNPTFGSSGAPTRPVGTGTSSVGSKASYCSGFKGSLALEEDSTTLGTVVKFVTCFITQLIVPLIFALAVLVFVWGGVKFIQASSSEDREKGQQFMLWGVIALAVMIGVWGLVAILGRTFGVESVIPQLNVPKQ